MLLMVALWGCGEPSVVQSAREPASEPAPKPKLLEKEHSFVFDDLKWDDAFLSNPGPTATQGVLVDLKHHDIAFHELARTGEEGFGTVYDLSGEPMEQGCNQQDFNAMFSAAGKFWLTSHFECTPGALYLSELAVDPEGKIVITSSQNVDFSKQGGLWNPCAGQVTPWGTHLASEEYEPDAFEEPTSLEEHGWDFLSWTRMKTATQPGQKLNPYDYGWTPEVAVMTPAGDTLVMKHKAPGRFSHEIAYVLPDERTVYLSDDGRGGGLFMFVADEKANLSSGTLYGARFFQKESKSIGGEGDVRWVNLGHATDKMVDHWIASGVVFSDMFERSLPDGKGACPLGSRFVDTDGTAECLKLKEPTEKWTQPALMASRLETRRYAAYMGATTEFEKGEGITYNPDRGMVYISFAKIGGRMVAEEGKMPAQDHMRLAENPCGAVWTGSTEGKLLDTANLPINSDHVITHLRSFIAGRPIEADANGNTCAPMGPANPDNIVYLPGHEVLMVAEDTKNHAVASLWAIDLRKSSIRRVMVAPRYGEITGLTWVPDLDGHAYLTVAIQHPWRKESLKGERGLTEGINERDQRSITGYLGPFPTFDR